MKNTEFPLKKNFSQDFLSQDWETLFTLRYDQATIEEYHEFFHMSLEDRMLELYSLVKKQIPLSLWEKILTFIFGKTFKGKIERSLKMENLCLNILENRFRTYESVYKSIEHLREDDSKTEKKVLFSANLSLVCQKYCMSPSELFKNFTLEQYMWLQDGIIFNMNESDKKWQAENQLVLVDREEVKRRAEETRKAFEELERKQK